MSFNKEQVVKVSKKIANYVSVQLFRFGPFNPSKPTEKNNENIVASTVSKVVSQTFGVDYDQVYSSIQLAIPGLQKEWVGESLSSLDDDPKLEDYVTEMIIDALNNTKPVGRDVKLSFFKATKIGTQEVGAGSILVVTVESDKDEIALSKKYEKFAKVI